jgi:rod shape-determining protein MreD
MTARVVARVVSVVVLFVLVQQTLVQDLRLGVIHPDIVILLPIMAGLVGGPSRGASMGFVAGLASDLFLPTPFGLSALVATMIGFAVGEATLAVDRTAVWLPLVAALGGSALYEVVYAVLGSVLGQPQMLHVDLTRIVVVVSVTNAVLALPAMRLVSWALPAASTEGVPTSPLSSGAPR